MFPAETDEPLGPRVLLGFTEVFELISRVPRRRRIRRLLLGLSGRLLLDRRLVVGLLLLRGVTGPVASDRSSGHRSDQEPPSPYPSSESHREPLFLVVPGFPWVLRTRKRTCAMRPPPLDLDYGGAGGRAVKVAGSLPLASLGDSPGRPARCSAQVQ